MTFIKANIEYETVGGIDIPLPKRPPLSKMGNYKKSKNQQKWTPTEMPDCFLEITRDENGYPEWSKEQWGFIEQEYTRMDEGYWFINNGEPTYISGYHYFELCYWKIDIGLKEYRDRDRRVHLFWSACVASNDCYGLMYVKHRRDGATARALSISYQRTISKRESLSGIQSKTGHDAKRAFQRLISSWRKLPEFLQPIHSGTTDPKTKLELREPAERVGKTTRRVKESQAINSAVGYLNSIATAYDGEKLYSYFLDEGGKTKEMKIATECWPVVRECLSLGDTIIGKAMFPSTVAEMTKEGGDQFKDLWDESDPLEIDENDRTVSGLWRLFIPASDGMEGFVDEFGISVIDEPTDQQRKYLAKIKDKDPKEIIGAKEFIKNRREGLRKKGNQEGLAQYKRQYPETISEAFTGLSVHCEFDLEKINTQLENLYATENPKYTSGDFIWKNGVRDSEVVWVPSKNGKFKMSWLNISPEDMNNVKIVGTKTDVIEETGEAVQRNVYRPQNTYKYVLGVDPYDHNVTTTGRGSKAAGYLFKKRDIFEQEEEYQDAFILQYLNRPPMAKIFYEDMLKVCMFFGCQMLYETQKPGIKTYFIDRGYGTFLMINPKESPGKVIHSGAPNLQYGLAASRGGNQNITEVWQEYIFENWWKIPFEELLEDLREFDPYKTEKFDATMGSGYALLGSKRYVKKPNVKEINLQDWFPSFNKHTGKAI